jgi:hypothetical protein
MFAGVFAIRILDVLQRKKYQRCRNKMSKCTAKDVAFDAQSANFYFQKEMFVTRLKV